MLGCTKTIKKSLKKCMVITEMILQADFSLHNNHIVEMNAEMRTMRGK